MDHTPTSHNHITPNHTNLDNITADHPTPHATTADGLTHTHHFNPSFNNPSAGGNHCGCVCVCVSVCVFQIPIDKTAYHDLQHCNTNWVLGCGFSSTALLVGKCAYD
jgi:hypothetical protein